MSKKAARKPGGAAGIAIIDESIDDLSHEANGSHSELEPPASKPARRAKAQGESSASGQFAVGDIKKAAAFANSVGGLEKAIALLQILKVAKEVQ